MFYLKNSWKTGGFEKAMSELEKVRKVLIICRGLCVLYMEKFKVYVL